MTIACYATHSATYLASMKIVLVFIMWNTNNVSAKVTQFMQDLRTLLDRNKGQAAAGGSLRKFAAGNAAAPNFQTLYALMQCTPDLSEQDCSDCLDWAMGIFRNVVMASKAGELSDPAVI
uniref:Gnk2-homologous domain-containing protein n=1 Tax=Fagus sylvatica TaxID=28930 RepID=A0A2N9ELF1_FAGSY